MAYQYNRILFSNLKREKKELLIEHGYFKINYANCKKPGEKRQSMIPFIQNLYNSIYIKFYRIRK